MLPSSRRLAIVLAAVVAAVLFFSSICVVAEDAGSSSSGSAEGSNSPTVSQLLKAGTVALTTGRMSEAIANFDAAIAAEPNNYLSYYRRATAYLSSGRTASALADLDQILMLNPKFAQAYIQKAKISAREGDLDAAKRSIQEYLMLKKGDEEAIVLSNNIEAALSNLKMLASAHANVGKLVEKGQAPSVRESSLNARLDDCLRHASQVLEVSPSLLEARRMRADCHLAKGEYESALGDWT